MLANTGVSQSLEHKLPKVISPGIHGLIDYGHAAFFLTVALACRKKNPAAAWAALGTCAFVLVGALFTDYPLGWKKVMSFRTHGKLDAGFAAMSPLVPSLLGFGGTTAARIFRANGLVEATVVGLTDFSSSRAHREAEDGSLVQ